MAYYIKIVKLADEADHVIYSFRGGGWDIPNSYGKIKMMKDSAEYELFDEGAECTEPLTGCVVRTLGKCWQTGAWPDVTDYAA